ncbi:Group XV phospholipase A2 [Nymphon striatum]|nr:Group XV phospholipase A2 [Nymphon striatum]
MTFFFGKLIFPGDGGSQLIGKLNRNNTSRYFCSRKTDDYFDMWLNLELLAPYVIECWIDNMKLIYDNVTRKSSNTAGVDIRTVDFGNTTSIDWLDPSKASPGRYFIDISSSLTKLGLHRGVSIRGAPYDFRRAPNDLAEYLANMTQLVEDTFHKNNNKKVVLVAHSMGCPTILYFLKVRSQSWKNKYIKCLVTLSGVYGGAVKALRTFASGDNLSVVLISPRTLRQEQRTFPSLAFLLPSDKFWNSSEVLIQTSKKNYTVQDYKQFFTDIDFMNGYYMWQDTSALINDLKPPGVELHCLHGVSVPTEESMIYKEGYFPNYQPTKVLGDGDGTVNLRSLEGCLRWKNSSKQKVYHQTFPKVDHMNILRHEPVLQYIDNLVKS